MTTPQVQIETLFVLDDAGRIVSNREPGPVRRPAFSLIRGATSCAWAVSAAVDPAVAEELEDLARTEPPVADVREPPQHADRYVALVGGRPEGGPAFSFPDEIVLPTGTELVDNIVALKLHFEGWTDEEFVDRQPVAAFLEAGHAVSICICARLSDVAAEAGLATAEPFRGKGYGPRVTAAWALAIRESGRIPLYSTSWTNPASLAVARKLGLEMYACDWSLWTD